jgi:hypothetical protein
VAGLAAAAYAGVLLAARTRAAGLVPALLLPALALGMNHPAPDGFVAAAVLLAGSVGDGRDLRLAGGAAAGRADPNAR